MKLKGKYGYIELKSTNDDGWDGQVETEVRKTTAIEREEIILNAIRMHSGKSFLIWNMARLFGVSERTVQKALRSLEA